MKALAVALAYVSVAAFSVGGAVAAETVRLTSAFGSSHPSSVSMREVFAPKVAEATGSELTVDLFPDAQLMGTREGVDAVRSGSVFGTWVGTAFFVGMVPELEAFSVPFLFDNAESALRIVDGPLGDQLNEKLAENGFLVLGWMDAGARHVTNNIREIRSVEDFNGLKLRMQPNETHLATFRALGAVPVVMDVKELFSALQQGVVDGQENPYAVIAANRYFEVQKYITPTGHFHDHILLVVNKSQFEAMAPETQEAIREAAAATVEHQRSTAAEAAERSLAQLREEGMIVTEMSEEMLQKMREVTAVIADEVKARAGEAFFEEVQNQLSAE